MAKRAPAIITVLLFIAFAFKVNAEDDWTVIRQEGQIKVSVRSVPGSKVHELRGEGIVAANAATILALLTEIRLMPRWIYSCISAQELEKNYDSESYNMAIDEYYKIVYAENQMPWPLQNRDYIFKSTLEYTPPVAGANDFVSIISHTIDYPALALQPGKVRLPLLYSRLDLIPLGKGAQTFIDFKIKVDPGGILPAWIVNLASRRIPYMTLIQLRKLAKEKDFDRSIEKLIHFHMDRLQMFRGQE